MTSMFDEHFRNSAAPMLMDYNGEQATISYTVGATTINDITAMQGHREVAEIEGPDGTIRKVWRLALHFMADQASRWAGIADPQFKGQFVIDGKTWKIEDRDALPIEGISKTMVSVNVIRKMATHKGRPGLREFT